MNIDSKIIRYLRRLSWPSISSFQLQVFLHFWSPILILVNLFHIIRLSGNIITKKSNNFKPILTFIETLNDGLTTYLCWYSELLIKFCNGNRLNVALLYLIEKTNNALLQIDHYLSMSVPYLQTCQTGIPKPQSWYW